MVGEPATETKRLGSALQQPADILLILFEDTIHTGARLLADQDGSQTVR